MKDFFLERWEGGKKRMSEKTDIKSMDLEELKTFFSDMGEKAFRAKQVYEWLHVRQVESFYKM